MTSKKSPSNAMDLSLTGSQVGTPTSSARSTGRPSSAKVANKPSSSSGSGARLKSSSTTNMNGMGSGSKVKTKANSRPTSSRTDTSALGSARSTARSTKNESSNAKNSLSNPNQEQRDDFLSFFEVTPKPKTKPVKSSGKSKPAWATPQGTPRSGVAPSEGGQSKGSKFSHSVFQPTSARSTSTVDELEMDNNLNNNWDSKPSPKEEFNFQMNNAHGDGARPQRQRSDSNENVFGQKRTDNSRDDLSQSRNRNYGGAGNANDFLNSQPNLSQKATKLNSIANNMTSQAFSPGNKTSLLGMENSYQNIKHKTPVNQVRQSPQVGRNIAEDYIKTCNMAATKIQRWFRRNIRRKKASEAAMRRMLDSKRQEIEIQRASMSIDEPNPEATRKKTREEKARQARLEAIAELQKKREQKRQDGPEEGQVKYLQANGKVSKTPSSKSNVNKKQSMSNKPKVQGAARGQISDSDSDNEPPRSSRSTKYHKRDSANGFVKNNDVGASKREDPKSASTSPRSDNSEELEENKADEATGNDSTPPPSQAASKQTTTFDDLMATLQKLEAEEKFPSARNHKNENPASWLDDFEKNSSHSEKEDFRLSADALEKLNRPKDNIAKSGLLTDEKLKSIMSYLDEVESAERLTEIDRDINRANDVLEIPAPLVPSSEEIAQIEQATANAAEVTNEMLTQKLDLEEKKRAVQMLQKALNQQRELTVRHAKETEKEMKKRLYVQKDEYEETIKRHLSFIDQLIDDKKSLSERCETLVKELKVVDKKYQDKIKGVVDSHDIELRKLKEVHAAAEKLRREKWIDEKTKKIKEMTVKGLEPEIQRLIAKHKAEVKKIKSIHEAELMASDERAGGRYIKMTEELRDQLAKEKELACARERDLARQTYEKQLQAEEEAFQQQRRRLYAEVQEEKERISQQASRQRTELDRLQRQLEDAHGKTISSTREEYEKARDEQEKRHTTETRQLKEQLAIEKLSWEENYKKKQETWLLQKERELKDMVRKDRDKEIEMVIQRLEEDNQGSREECERVAENRIKRIRDKYEAEMSELERSERKTMEKYNQTKALLADIEGENERKVVILKQKEKEVNDIKKLLDKLNNERDHVSDVIRQEFADRLVATDEENRRLKNDMSEMKSRNRVEVERALAEIEVVKKAKDEEMEEVHKRVKHAILKKEDVVAQLQQQFQASQKRAEHLEGLLEQQRKQLLGRKK